MIWSKMAYLALNSVTQWPMPLIIYPGMTPQEIHRQAREMRKKFRYDFRNLCGTIVISEDPLVVQKGMRKEWE
ncbi:MAG: hypothetical protein ACK52I_12580 [Pseudomonadota bacterium]